MKIYISIKDDAGIRETTSPIEVDDELLVLANNKVNFICDQIKPYVEAMINLEVQS